MSVSFYIYFSPLVKADVSKPLYSINKSLKKQTQKAVDEYKAKSMIIHSKHDYIRSQT